MKTPLSFYLVAAVAGTFACSSDEGTPRDQVGAGGSAGQSQVGNAGSSSAGSGGSGVTNTAGTGGGGSGTTANLGPALTINADGTVKDTAGTTGLDGLAQVIKSPMGTMITPGVTFQDGKLCMAGTTAVVPGMDYTNYWGAEIDLDLKLSAPSGGGGGAADAGADAGGDAGAAPAQVPVGWNASAVNVVGFSFKIDGPTMPGSFRFKGLPFGANSSTTTYCNQVPVMAGSTYNIRFDQVTFECWNPAGAGLLSMPYPPDNPDGKLLRTISWQVPADVVVPFPFDFCISDLKPILAN